MPAILVTGGAGYVGSHTCKALAAAGYTPVAFDNLSLGHRWAVRWGPLEVADLADIEAIRRTLRRHACVAVLHFAASAYVGESMNDPGKYFRNNAVHSLNLLEAMVDCGVEALVLSSSCATYGPPERLPMAEDHPQRPASPYGESKLAVERMAAWFGRVHGLKWMALRYFNAGGADEDGDLGELHLPETHLIPLAVEAALGGAPLVVHGNDYATPDGTAIRDFVHVADLAEAHVRALRHLLGGGESGAVNLGSGAGWSVREVAAAIERIAGRPVPLRFGPRRPGDPPALVADASRASAMLDWRSRRDFDAIIASAWRWHTRAWRMAG